MFVDKRNNNKVVIIRSFKDTVMVKDIKTNKRYLVDKCHLKEIKV